MLSDIEVDIAQQYNRHRPTTQQRRQLNFNPQFNILCVLILVVFCAVFVIIFSLTLLSVLAIGGFSQHQYINKPVNSWNHEDTLDWLNTLGDTVQRESYDIFKREKIDGRHLVTMNHDNLLQFGMESNLSRTLLMVSINHLKEFDYVAPRNFYEFKAANRGDTVFLFFTYKIFPRLTFGYIYLFHYYDMFLPIINVQLNPEPFELISNIKYIFGIAETSYADDDGDGVPPYTVAGSNPQPNVDDISGPDKEEATTSTTTMSDEPAGNVR
jgi:hypothetical protein